MEPPQGQRRWLDVEPRPQQPEIVAGAGPEHHAVLAEVHRLRVRVGGDVPDGQEPHGVSASSAQTVNSLSVLGPNVLLIATSVASRPRAISTRPMRGVLLRASKVCHLPPM